VVALVWPSPTALVLTLVVGIWAFAGGCLEIFAGFFSIFSGATLITQGIELKRTGKTLHSILPQAAKAA
jgi:hypothetical protein